MNHPMGRRGGRYRPANAAMLLLIALSACTTTRFPDNPEQHRLWGELEAAGDPYYFNVRSGLSSRLLGIMPEEEARSNVAEIRSRWGEIDPLDSAESLMTYLTQNGLSAVTERIQETLRQNEDDEPATGVDEHLQAAALKQGMIDAAHELDATPQ